MCLSKNCAPQAIRYLNAQLEALYQNARECAVHHRGQATVDERNRPFIALAEYYEHPTKNSKQFDFRATFSQPELAFICNHDAIIRIHVAEGELFRDGKVEKLPALKAEFRVAVKHSRACEASDIGKVQLTRGDIDLIVFEFTKAEVVRIVDKDGKPTIWSHDSRVEKHLADYLKYLTRAGNNVLYSLPQFDEHNTAPFIDYSVTNSLNLTRSALEGITVEEINMYLRAKWLKAALLATEEVGDVPDWRLKALSELKRSEITGSIPFDVAFGRPSIQLVCSREAILTFKVAHIKFYDAKSGDRVINEWRNLSISVMLDIEHTKVDHGKVEICKVDINTAKLVRQKFVEPDFSKDTDGAAKTRWEIFLSFIPRYLAILQHAGDHVVYRRDARWPIFVPGFEKGYLPETDATKGEVWKETAQHSSLHNFDQVMVISQKSVDAHFVDLYNRFSRSHKETGLNLTWLVNYALEKDDHAFPGYKLNAKFVAPDFRFLSNEKAIVWVNIENGSIHQPTGAKISFEKLCLAFEVPVGMKSHYRLPKEARATLEKTVIFDGMSNPETARVKHIFFDFENPDFLSEYSVLDALLDNDDAGVNDLDAAKFIVRHIKSTYLSRLSHHGLNVLHSIPIRDVDSKGSSVYGLTGVRYHTFARGTIDDTSVVVDRKNWPQVRPDQLPVLVILGLCHRELSQAERSFELPISEAWLRYANQKNSLGTLAISRKNFLDHILAGLERINRMTTLVPEFSRPKRHEKVLQKVTLGVDDEHDHYSWTTTADVDALKFKYAHSDDWRYEHKGAVNDEHNGTYRLSCATVNELTVPTSLNQFGLDMHMKSDVTVNASFESEATRWSLTSGAELNLGLNLQTIDNHDTLELDFQGVHRNPTGKWLSNFDVSQKHADGNKALAQINLNSLLHQHLTGAAAINLTDIARHMEPLSRKVWGACLPGWFGYKLIHAVFNTHGDLFFELRPYGLAIPPRPTQSNSQPVAAPVSDAAIIWLDVASLGFEFAAWVWHLPAPAPKRAVTNGTTNGHVNGAVVAKEPAQNGKANGAAPIASIAPALTPVPTPSAVKA